MNKAVFIDRDGVVNSDEGHYYVFKIEDFIFNADLSEALSILKKAGFLLILITNQGGVAKGIYTEEDVNKLHAYMQNVLREKDAAFDAIYYCPHHNNVKDCMCRKPKPGMLLKAAKEYDIDFQQSYLIGDSPRDVQAGEAAGVATCYRVKKNSSILDLCISIANNIIRL